MVKLLVTELGVVPRYVTGSRYAMCLHLALFDNPESLAGHTPSYYDTRRQLHSGSCLVDLAFHPVCRCEQPSKEAINPVSKPRLAGQ